MNQTIIDIFIERTQFEQSIVGDYCSDLLMDAEYPSCTSVEEQMEYIRKLAFKYSTLIEPTDLFLKRLQEFQSIIL
jgi:hypothetical protein